MVVNVKNENSKVVCDGKSIMNIFMFIFGLFMTIVLIYLLIKYEIGTINLILIIVLILCVFLSVIYLLLKILNFNFYINNSQIIYSDIWNKKCSYSINDIKDCKQFYSGKKTGIIITMNDDMTIKIIDVDRNYHFLRKYLLVLFLV